MSATHIVASRALVQEREICKEGRKLPQQVPIYFIFEALVGSKKHYSEREKISYVVILNTRKLHHYFEGNRFRVLTSQPLNDNFRNQDCSSRIGNGPWNYLNTL
jgi:hypothetical protein